MTNQNVRIKSLIPNIYFPKPDQKGISLIELLIYIAILGSILVLVLSLASTALRGRGKTNETLELSSNLRFSLERISLAIRDAQDINSPSPGTTANSLSLKMENAAQDPTLFSANSGTLYIKEGTGSDLALTSSEIEVLNFQVQNIQNQNAKQAISITLSLKSKETGKIQEVKTTVSLRK